jgi:hypothetical protein
VQEQRVFKANNIYSEFYGDANTEWHKMRDGEPMYVVYSYGEHWPLFIYHYLTDTWFENSDKRSVTTSKHRSQAHPHAPTRPVPCSFMKDIVFYGLVEATARNARVQTPIAA